jgi:hypothetical protein
MKKIQIRGKHARRNNNSFLELAPCPEDKKATWINLGEVVEVNEDMFSL